MVIDKIALTLSIIGALNWGSVGLFGFDCVAFLFGGQTGMLSRVIYTLVGLPVSGASRCCFVRPSRWKAAARRKNKRRGGLPSPFIFLSLSAATRAGIPVPIAHRPLLPPPARASSGGTGGKT